MATVIHIIAGLVLGMLAFYFLMMPARERDLNRRRDEELTSYIQMLNSANQENETLQAEYDTLEAQAQEVQTRLDELTTGNTSIMAQYQTLIQILQNYRTGDLVTAATTFAQSSFDLIEDEGIQAIVENVRQDMATNVYQILVENGLTQWNAGNQDTAMTYFQASLAIQPANPEAMYYVARLYQDAGDMENANAMFDRVVNEYPDSEYAGRSQNARGY